MLAWLSITALAQAPLAEEPPTRVEIFYQEAVELPEEFSGDRPLWKTNRLGQALLVDSEDRAWALDLAGRTLRSVDVDGPLRPYRFPLKYFKRWDEPWMVVEDSTEVPLADGPDFTGAFLATRWGSDPRDALVRLARHSIEIYSVTPPPDFVPYPACYASVPESCLASAVTILREYAGDPKAKRLARAQIDRACSDGVVRACFMGVTLSNSKLSQAAQDCLDDNAEACATVAGSLYAEARLQGESSKAGERMLEHACELGVAGACSEAAQMYDERELPHNALLMLDRACVSGDRAACDQVEQRRDRAFATGISKACLKDSPEPVACITLAQFLEEKPLDELGIDAFGAWQRACAGGEDTACRAMAPYIDQWGVDDSRVVQATSALLATCEAGSPEACVGAAHLLVRLDTRDPRYARSRQLYTEACEAGSNLGCVAAAEQSWAGPARKLEFPDAAALYTLACERDDASACAGLGHHLLTASRTHEDAIAPLEKGCELGSARACTELGKLAQEGHHRMELDPVEVFQSGCDQGEPEACYQLGLGLAGGPVTDPSTPAYAAFQAACEGGNNPACEAVGRSHLSLQTHYEAGVASGYFDRACEAGLTDSCHELGMLYRKGFGVPRDPKRGRQFLQRAGELQPIKHVRLGARVGFLNLVGVDTELVLPLPVGPAISVGGDFSLLPGQGLSMAYIGPTVRIYPSHNARGLYAAAGWHQFRIKAKDTLTTNSGFNGRVGVRVQQNLTWGGVEIGLASVDAPRVRDLIKPIPLVVPVFGISGGIAFL